MYQEIVDKWRAETRQRIPDLDTSESSNVFKIMYPILSLLNEKYGKVQDFIDNQYVYTAEGTHLDRILSNFNFIRKQASQSTVEVVSENCTPFAVIGGNFQLQDNLGNVFFNQNTTQANSEGHITLTMKSVEAGASQNILENTLNEIVTPVAGVGDFTNLERARGGQDTETDIEFRMRYLQGRVSKGLWNKDGIQTALQEINGVEFAVVEENDTNATVGVLTPHSIRCIVEGGNSVEIANVIFNRKSAGVQTIGSTGVEVFDINGNSVIITFQRPSLVDVEIQFVVTGSVNQAEFETALLDYINQIRPLQTMTSWKASNFIEKRVDISNVSDIVIEFRRAGGTFSNSLTLTATEKPNGVLI